MVEASIRKYPSIHAPPGLKRSPTFELVSYFYFFGVGVNVRLRELSKKLVLVVVQRRLQRSGWVKDYMINYRQTKPTK